MTKQSNAQEKFLVDATVRYHRALAGSPVAEHLADRGLELSAVEMFRLGFVVDPLPGHEMYKGMMAIPYLRRSAAGQWAVASIRFRCIEPHDHREMGHGKYNTVAGDTPRIFNTLSIINNHDRIAICEGEIDAITASVAGVPAVGIAGVETWKDHFQNLFVGYETVYILADGDRPGMEFASKVAKKLKNARIVPSEPGEDVNSEFVKYGPERLKEKLT